MNKGYIVDWTRLEKDNANLQKKKIPFGTLKKLQKALRNFLSLGDVEKAEKTFETIKDFFRKGGAKVAA